MVASQAEQGFAKMIVWQWECVHAPCSIIPSSMPFIWLVYSARIAFKYLELSTVHCTARKTKPWTDLHVCPFWCLGGKARRRWGFQRRHQSIDSYSCYSCLFMNLFHPATSSKLQNCNNQSLAVLPRWILLLSIITSLRSLERCLDNQAAFTWARKYKVSVVAGFQSQGDLWFVRGVYKQSFSYHFLYSIVFSVFPVFSSIITYDLCINQRSWVERRMLALLPLALSSQSAAWFNYWMCGRNNMKWKRIADDCCIFAHKVGTDSIPFLQTRSQVSQVLFAEICAHWSISTSGCGLWESDFLGQRTKDSWTPTSRHVCDLCDRDIGWYLFNIWGLDVYGPQVLFGS